MDLGEILKDLPERFSLRSSYGRLSKLNQCAMNHVTRICDKCDIIVVQDTQPVTGDGGSEGSDSEDEIVNVDEPDEMETETVPLTQAERLAENLRTQNCKFKYKYDTTVMILIFT